MNTLFCVQAMVVLTAVMPTVCMKNNHIVNFVGDINAVPILERNLKLMEAWEHHHYHNHKEVADKGGLVPLFDHISAHELQVVNNALMVGPHKFSEHYAQLSKRDKLILQRTSGTYGYSKKTLMLSIPELTKQLVDICLPSELRNYIKKCFNSEDEDDIRNYVRQKLIMGKMGLLPLKTPMMLSDHNGLIRDTIYPSSLFLNGYHTNHCDSPIPLSIAGAIHQTYASHFVSDRCEYRITDIKGKQCTLWIINHDALNDSNYTFAKIIEHEGAVKGCCLSKTGTGVEYAVTYSECDMVFSKITTHNDISFVESHRAYPFNNGIIVDACFNHAQDRLIVGAYEGMGSVVRMYDMDGKYDSKNACVSRSFKKHGLLEKLFIASDASDKWLIMLFAVAEKYAVHSYKREDNGDYGFFSSSTLMKMDEYNMHTKYFGAPIMKRGKSIFMYNRCCSPFAAIVAAEKQKSCQDWLAEIINGSRSNLDSECYRIYSPDGKFLLCNTLIKTSGTLHIETVLKDAVTHKQILPPIGTSYDNFVGIGFAHDSTELIFLSVNLNCKMSLLNSDDNAMLQEIKRVAFGSFGITSLLKRLCMECTKHGTVKLYEGGPTYAMLCDWARTSPMLKKFIKRCLPIETTKEMV